MKRMIKRILSVLLVAVMLLTAAPLSGFVGLDIDFSWLDFSTKSSALDSSGSCGDNVTYTFDSSTGLLTISGTGDMYNYSSSKFPFEDDNSIKSVVINNGVTSIGYSAFRGCTALTSITIPDSVTRIDSYAITGCTGLTSITIPDSITRIGDFAFGDCTGLTSVTIPDGVTSIGAYAFYNCKGLTSITIPDSVTSIGGYAFYNCYRLTNITIPDSVTWIGEGAFINCTGLTRITVDSNNKVYDSREDCNAIIETETNILIQGCKNTTIPDSVTSIGEYAFQKCTGLTSITIPDSVTSIGAYAFYYCTGLTSITIPDSVTSIGGCAFNCCCRLTNITIPDSVTSIGSGAFAGCNDLTSITIPEGITNIGSNTFDSCTELTSITIPDSVKSIGEHAFESCTGLTSITIGSGVTSIGYGAFYFCTGLKSVNYTGTKENWCRINFSNIDSNPVFYAGFLYINGNPVGDVVIPNGVNDINYLFRCCKNLTSITIPNSVTSISNYVFASCTGLTRITVDSNNTVYDSRENCNAIIETETNTLIQGCKNTIIPDSVTSIGNSAFINCTDLTSITIPDSVTSIGDSAFSGCTGLTSITIPDSVTIIGSYAFSGCTFLTSVTIGNSVTSIGGEAFQNCTSLTSITIPDSVTSIGSCAFRGCTALKDVYYSGTEEEWNAISFGSSNGYLLNANIHYNSSGITEEGEIRAEKFDPESSSGIYQINGKLESFTLNVVLNSPTSYSYVGSVTINGNEYKVKKDVLTEEKAEQLKGKNVICNYDNNTDEITAISKCREFSNLSVSDVININKSGRVNVTINSEYKWNHGKVYVKGGTREVTSIPFDIYLYNSLPSEYFDLSEDCMNNPAFDYEISSINVSGISNCGNINLFSYQKTVKLGESTRISGSIVLPSDFWLTYEDSEKTIEAEYEIVLSSNQKIKGTFQTVVKNSEYQIKTEKEKDTLAETVYKLKNTSAISLAGLYDLGFTTKQINYLEKLVLVELSLYTIPGDSLDDYVSKKVMEKIFGVKTRVGVSDGKMTIVVPTTYQGQKIQVDIVCDIKQFSLNDRNFGSFDTLSYHAYKLTKNGKREEVAFKDGVAGLTVSADVEAFAEAATDLALDQIKSASKKVLNGYEEVERLIFGDVALKILSAAGYDSFFDFGWELYVNKCKELAFSCPVDIYVYDKNDTLCGAIVNNEVTLDNSDAVDLCVNNDEKIVTLWDDGYYIKTLSNCKGSLNISVKEKGYVNGDVRSLTFENLPLDIGTIYQQGCGEDYYDDQEAYAVEMLNGEKFEATSDVLSIQPLTQVTATFNANGGEVTETSKTVYNGEYVVLPTASRLGYNLLGWSTSDNNTPEFDAGSVLKITADTTLFAVWEEKATSKPFVYSVSIDDIKLNYKKTSTLNPHIEADEGAEYTVTYTSSNPSVARVDENGKVTATKKGSGSATITCTVTDEYGNTVTDTCTVKVSLNFGQILLVYVLFGWIWY